MTVLARVRPARAVPHCLARAVAFQRPSAAAPPTGAVSIPVAVLTPDGRLKRWAPAPQLTVTAMTASSSTPLSSRTQPAVCSVRA